MNLLSLLGIDAQLEKLRTAVGEGALAVEDRVQLARMEWQEEKNRLKLVFTLALALLGLTVVAMTILSLAVVVQFWDSPDRAKAAWMVAGAWLVLWLGAAIGLIALMRRGEAAFGPTREELEKDWISLKSDIAPGDHRRSLAREKAKAERPETKQALLERIGRQRERLAKHPVPAATQAGSAGRNGLPPSTRAVAQGGAEGASPSQFRSATMRNLQEHPVATLVVAGGVVATVAALGPRRVLRMASWILPLVLPRR
jgi:uncharacterized membrane protein YqjE